MSHRQQPTRLLRPWDSPGKNTGVGCHFLLQCMKVKSESEVTESHPALSDPMDCSLPGSSIHGIFQVRVLEWVAIAFSTAAAKLPQLCLTLCDPRDDSPPGSPIPGILQARTLEWVAISFSNLTSYTYTTQITVPNLYNQRQWHPTPVLLPGKSHGWRNLVGGSPWCCEESDTTE